jgi:hypothetical protein
LLLAAACLLPFLNKPFLIDDPHFLKMARQILQHPLHPMDFDICWNLVDYCVKAYNLTPGNSLLGYVLVPTVISGSKEWMAHLTQLVFVAVAIVFMTSLVLRLGWGKNHATAGALLLVVLPPFLPMASTAMPDVLATAVALVAIERLVAWTQCRRWHQGLLAAIAIGMAGIARAHLALLVPLSAFFLLESLHPLEVLRQARRDWSLWAPVLGGGLILCAAILATREHGLAIDPPTLFSGLQTIPRNLRSYLFYLCLPLPLAAAWAANRWKTGPRRLAFMLCAAIAVGAVLPGKLSSFLAALGFCVLADLLFEAWKSRNQLALFCLLWLLIPLPIVYYGHLPIKYLLPCMPAVILICFTLAKALPPRIVQGAGILLISGAALYSVLILRSDAELAELGRSAMFELIGPHAAKGETVWYANEFSAYWYASMAGGKLYMVGASDPKPGDLLAVGIREGSKMLTHFPKRTLLKTVSHKYLFGRTMWQGVGLYTNIAGNLLWGFGDSENDRYELWRIE